MPTLSISQQDHVGPPNFVSLSFCLKGVGDKGKAVALEPPECYDLKENGPYRFIGSGTIEEWGVTGMNFEDADA